MNRPNIFIPSNQVLDSDPLPEKTPFLITLTEAFLTTFLQFVVVLLVGFLPILFLVGSPQLISSDRLLIVSTFVGLSIVAASVLILFRKNISSVVSLAPLCLLAFVVWGTFSAYVNADMYDSLWGNGLETQTLAFSLLMFLLVLMPFFLQFSKRMQLRALGLFFVVAVVVLIHTFVRYMYGMSFLDFGKLLLPSESLIGSLYDSAVFAGLVVVLGLVALVMLPLRTYTQLIVTVVMALSWAVLSLVNFDLVWYGVFFATLVTTAYIMLKKPLFQKERLLPVGTVAKATILILFFMSLIGAFAEPNMTVRLGATDTDHIFERPVSFSDSLSISRQVYQEDLWLGVGPNKFEDAWRLYKDKSVNQSIFWNTDLSSGHSYVTDVFIGYGLVGGLLLVLFHLFFLWFGLTKLISSTGDLILARFTTTATFVGAVFLWSMSYLYTPGATILLLAALFTGLTFAGASTLRATKIVTVNVVTNRIRGFVVLCLSLLLIFLTTITLLAVFDKYTEQVDSTYSLDTQNDEIVGKIADNKLEELNQLIATANPQSVTQEDLLKVSEAALVASKRAVELDGTNPLHLERLATLYSLLGAIGVDGGHENARNTLEQVTEIDPVNPKHYLALARVAIAEGNTENANMALDKAIELKPNYRQAFQLQTDLAIASGDIEETIVQIENKAQLDPGNQYLWYQLGVLHSSLNQRTEAIQMLLRAIRIDPTYADARYVLAFQYLAEDRQEEALRQLNRVKSTNQNNTQLITLIEKVTAGEEIEMFESIPVLNATRQPVDSETADSVPSDVVTEDLNPDTENGVVEES